MAKIKTLKRKAESPMKGQTLSVKIKVTGKRRLFFRMKVASVFLWIGGKALDCKAVETMALDFKEYADMHTTEELLKEMAIGLQKRNMAKLTQPEKRCVKFLTLNGYLKPSAQGLTVSGEVTRKVAKNGK